MLIYKVRAYTLLCNVRGRSSEVRRTERTNMAFMAIYHFSAKVVSRSSGRSVVAAAAYRSGERLTNERDGVRHDYSRRQDVSHAEVLAPGGAPSWMSERGALWNGVESVERRKDAQLAREIEVSLPRELTAEQRVDLVRGFVREQFVARGMVADISIHTPQASDGGEQPHAHVLLTLRGIEGAGFGKKQREWNDRKQLEDWRASWSSSCNQALELGGHSERVDHRSLEAQGIEREPEPKLGVRAQAMERRGLETERGQVRRQTQERNRLREEVRRLADRARRIAEDTRRRLVSVNLVGKVREALSVRPGLGKSVQEARQQDRELRWAERIKAAGREIREQKAQETAQREVRQRPTRARGRDRGIEL